MRRLAIQMKDGLAADEPVQRKGKLGDTDKKLLYRELAHCAVSPNYLSTLQGREFVAFLLSLDESLADAIYDNEVDDALAHMSSEQVHMLAQTYILAWKAVEDQPQALVLEAHLRKVMMWTVNGDLTESHHANLYEFLKELHLARRERSVSDMLCRCYFPVLWCGFEALHYKIRHSAAKIFFDLFPLVESTQHNHQQELVEQFKLMHKLLGDACPDVRVVAVEGVLRVLTDFYEITPIHERKALVKDLISKNAKDMNSMESRILVNKGLSYMAGNRKAHTLLKTLIAKNKECLEDVCLVKMSYVSLLLVAQRIPGFKFWDVVEPKELLPLMADDKPQLSLQLAKLLCNSYFNPMADQRQNLECSLLLHSLNRVAFRIFYTLLADIAPLKSIGT
ncbi:hypothetical protein V5799_034130 [Amblyomma americanum]|uniref:Uncharacterized protein n=1 Tax=Amblyomma americanum TaxID=6943 RepID=A0AAQ4DLC1_AMBAM